MIASGNGHERIVQLLIDAGANKDLQDKVRISLYVGKGSPGGKG